jgi:hypothetical protein
MTEAGVTVLVTVSGVLLSIAGSLFIAGSHWGGVKARLIHLESKMPDLATTEQMNGIKQDVAEIKGMFQMVPRNSGGRHRAGEL